MKKFFLIPLIFILSCGTEKAPQTEAEDSSPPSLTSEEEILPEILEISDKQLEELNLQSILAEKKITQVEIAAPGTVYPDPTTYSIVSSPISGRVSKIYAHEGENVLKGQVIAELQSLEFASMISDYVRSEAETEYFKSQLDRLTKLTEQKISPQSELELVKSEYQRALATNKGMYAKLLSIGLNEKQIESFATSDKQTNPVYEIKSPISGIIDKHLIELGQSVDMYQKLMDIIDNRTVLIKGYLSPEDAAIVNKGDTVITISQKSNENKEIIAIVKSINPALDEENKSVVINIYANTKNSFPRPGENVRLSVLTYSSKEVVSVPLSSVTYFRDIPVIFIQKDKNTFEIRQVKICRTTDNIAVLCEGVDTGEKIITNQVFSLKALTKFSEYAE